MSKRIDDILIVHRLMSIIDKLMIHNDYSLKAYINGEVVTPNIILLMMYKYGNDNNKELIRAYKFDLEKYIITIYQEANSVLGCFNLANHSLNYEISSYEGKASFIKAFYELYSYLKLKENGKGNRIIIKNNNDAIDDIDTIIDELKLY